jgi:hypothetical protein
VLTRGEPASARPLLERALRLRRSVLGEDHPDTLESGQQSRPNLYELGQHEQARQLDDDTLTRYRRVLGEDHPRTLASASNLVADLRALGRDEANQLEEWVRSHG